MNKSEYEQMGTYMSACMQDSAHDREHVYRVLYTALELAEWENDVNYDILIAACLLHDIGRQEQFDNPNLCHAAVGAEKAYAFLTQNGYDVNFAEKVASCIRTHRYRGDNLPQSIEAKILFDADKIDVTGAVGIARTLLYQGKMGEPLYSLDPNGEVSDGSHDTSPSFFQEYKRKLESIDTKFYTKRGSEIALCRKQSAVSFYESLLKEVKDSYRSKEKLFHKFLT